MDKFEDFILKKIKIKYSQDEVVAVWDYFKPDLHDHVHYMSIHNELRYSEYLNIAKSCRITIEDYLLKAYDYLNKEFYQLAEELFKLENIENLEELKSILVNSNIN